MDSLWPLELVRYAADKMLEPGADRGYGPSVGHRFPSAFIIEAPKIFRRRIEIIGVPDGM